MNTIIYYERSKIRPLLDGLHSFGNISMKCTLISKTFLSESKLSVDENFYGAQFYLTTSMHLGKLLIPYGIHYFSSSF